LKKKRIILSVTNDLATDNRVHKVATTLQNNGYNILLVGRKFSNSLSLSRNYSFKRFRLIFNKSVLFYIEFNLRLFLFLMFTKADVFLSNDLDTLLANFIASKLRRKKIVYDSHELFTEVPELVKRPKIQKIWLKIEQFILPKLNYSYTVCDSVAEYYNKKYNLDMKVVRNVPICSEYQKTERVEERRVIIYQGAVNLARGLEEIIAAMKFLDDFVLWIIGSGDIIGELKNIVEKNNLEERVVFWGRIKFEKLWKYTIQADLGLSIEKNVGLNYFYALPNKIFDYIQAEVPVLCSNFPEMSNIVKKYDIGSVLKSREPQFIAKQIKELFADKKQYNSWKNNLKKAKKELCWQNEQKVLLKLI